MKQELSIKPENLICCMCPSIRKCHFEVKQDVKDLFEEEFKNKTDISRLIKNNHIKKVQMKNGI